MAATRMSAPVVPRNAPSLANSPTSAWMRRVLPAKSEIGRVQVTMRLLRSDGRDANVGAGRAEERAVPREQPDERLDAEGLAREVGDRARPGDDAVAQI